MHWEKKQFGPRFIAHPVFNEELKKLFTACITGEWQWRQWRETSESMRSPREMEEGGRWQKRWEEGGDRYENVCEESDEEGGDRYDSDSEENDEMTNSMTRRCDIDM